MSNEMHYYNFFFDSSRLQETSITMLTNGNTHTNCNSSVGLGNTAGNGSQDDTIEIALTSDCCQQHNHQFMWECIMNRHCQRNLQQLQQNYPHQKPNKQQQMRFQIKHKDFSRRRESLPSLTAKQSLMPK